MPQIEMSDERIDAINLAMLNIHVKNSRVLDTKEGKINTISIMVLLEKFNERNVISGLKLISEKIDRDFCTISYIIKAINSFRNEGIL